MKWITLKMHMLPIIFQEIDIVTEKYIGLLNNIRKCEEEDESSQNQIQEFNDMRESITKRINELETFYEDNIEDIRITSFEKARQRLKKLLMYDVETISKIENSSHNIPLLANKKNQGGIQSDPKANQENISNNITEKGLKSKTDSLSTSKNQTSQARTVCKNESLKETDNKPYIKPINKGKKETSSDNQNVYKKHQENSIDNGDITNCKEIVFKIRLNETEYKLLMKEKTKMKQK